MNSCLFLVVVWFLNGFLIRNLSAEHLNNRLVSAFEHENERLKQENAMLKHQLESIER